MIIETSPGDDYLECRYSVQGRDFVEAGVVSYLIKKALKHRNISESIIRKVAVVTFEVELNIISYAYEGVIECYVMPDAIIIEAKDHGVGIEDIELAQVEGYSTADESIREMGFGAGMGLANIKKFSDVFEILSEPGKGTYVKSLIRLKDI